MTPLELDLQASTLLRGVLAFALFETLVLAGVLWHWADRVAGGRLLAAFLVGIAVWICGNELPNWFGLAAAPVALRLLSTAAFTSAFFFHFCVVFCRVAVPRWGVRGAYLLGGGGSLLALLKQPGTLLWNEHVGWYAVTNWVGVLASLAWVLLGIAGVAVLLRGSWRARPPLRQQIRAVTVSCLWGLLCLAGYGLVLLRWPGYPWPLLLLPLYPLILVYGVLRYGVFVANAWAGRALVWTLLLALGLAVVALMPLLLPFESRWLNGLAVAAACLALNGPVRRFAERLIYPGAEVSAGDLVGWQRELLQADSLQQLAELATALLSRRLGMPLQVGWAAQVGELPQLLCEKTEAGWQTRLDGWAAAPPGSQRVAELFGGVLAEAAARVEQAQQVRAQERERQLQARLAELGSLAATVAHDIRNPLNIISMAVATAPVETRREVAEQVARVAHLASDLLDYAKPWRLQTAPTDVSLLARRLVLRQPGVELGEGLAQPLWRELDARRIEQALGNLLENARSAGSRVLLDAEVDREGSLKLLVCDDGPGVPPDLRERLFEPFASRSPGGTGLGLAIVARVAAAHGGSATLAARPRWTTCFCLHLPP